MSALIDTIQRAFRDAVLDAGVNGGEVRSDTIVEAIEIHAKADLVEIEWAVTAAYCQARFEYGNMWTLYPGHVAELVIEHLREYALSDAV